MYRTSIRGNKIVSLTINEYAKLFNHSLIEKNCIASYSNEKSDPVSSKSCPYISSLVIKEMSYMVCINKFKALRTADNTRHQISRYRTSRHMCRHISTYGDICWQWIESDLVMFGISSGQVSDKLLTSVIPSSNFYHKYDI